MKGTFFTRLRQPVRTWMLAGIAMCGASTVQAVEFTTSSVTVQESDGTATLVLGLGSTPQQTVSVTVIATHGTATVNQDYTFSSTVVTWAANDGSDKTVTIPILQDAVTEGAETAYFALTNVVGDQLGSQNTIQLTITDPNETVAGDQGLTEEQRDAAEVLDTLCSPGSTIEGCELMEQLSDAEQAQALETIMPRQVVQQASNAMVAQAGNTQAVRQRMQNVRTGNAAPLTDFRLMSGDEVVSLGTLLEQVYFGGSAGDEVGDNALSERWGVFLSGQVQTADQDSTTEILGYQSDSQMITAGLDYRFSSQMVIGSAFSFSQTETESNADAGEQDTDVSILNLYGSYYFTDNLYLDLVLSGGSSDFDMKRNYRFGGTVVGVDSDTSGDQWGLSLALGIDHTIGAWVLDGFARAETRQMSIDEYTESGGAGLALAVGEQDVDSNLAVLGGGIAWVKSFSYGVWIPKLTVEWVREMEDDSRDVTAYFVADPAAGSFALATVDPDQDYFNVGGTLVGTFKHGRSAYFRYESVVDRDDFMAQTYELGVRAAF